MNRQSKILNFDIKETIEEIESLKNKNPKYFRRLHLLYLIKSNTYSSMKDIEKALATHRRTLNTWLDMYNQFGISSLIKDNRTTNAGRRYNITPKAEKGLIDKLNSDGFASYKEALEWFNSTYGTSMKYVSFWNYVHKKLGAKLKVARPSHIKKTK